MLGAINLVTDERFDLSEVPYVAAASDTIRLSRDGRVLYHQASRTPTNRIGIFDLRAPAGERLIGAPETTSGLHAIAEARGTGHVAAFRSAEHTLILTDSLYLNIYEGADLISLAPDGTDALLDYSLTGTEARSISLASLVTNDVAEVARIDGPLSSVIHAWSGETVAGRVFVDGQSASIFGWRWSDRASFERDATNVDNLRHVTSRGALIVEIDRIGLTYIDEDGLIRTSFRDERLRETRSIHRDAGVLVSLRDNTTGDSRWVVIAQDGTERELAGGDRSFSVTVGPLGQRAAYVTSRPDETDPTMTRQTIFAGAI